MGEEYPNYYSVIPSHILFDNELKGNVKVLYGVISTLANKDGFCWASNSYFADKFELTNTTVSRYISTLVDKGYIKRELIKNEKGEIEKRKLYINAPFNQAINTPCINSNEGVDRIDKDNTTSTNNTSINKNTTMSKSENIPHQKIKDLYNSICKSLDEIKLVTSKRRDKIQTRWKELKVICEDGQAPIDLIEIIFKKVEASDFLTNRRKSSNPKYQDFKVDFNWIFDNDTNYVKVLEGKYDNPDNDNRNNYDKQSAEERRQKILEAQRKRFQRDD